MDPTIDSNLPADSRVEPAIDQETVGSPRQRKIIHVDMDAFFASVEQRDNHELRGKPVAVGGSRERGVVAAASYEARQFGVRSAMPSVTARRKCPELIFVPARFDVYRQVSGQIHEIFAEYTPLIEPLSLDEAYLDVTDNLKGMPVATEIAAEIRSKIFAVTGLTASAGISYNKFLAKLGSGQNKPNGQFLISPAKGPSFVETLKVSKFHGVGPATAARMIALGIETGADLRSRSLPFLQQHFGKAGGYYYGIARGIDDRPVRTDRIRKSVGAETTFVTDLTTIGEVLAEIQPLIEKVSRYCVAKEVRGRTVTLKVKFSDFEQITRGRSVPMSISNVGDIRAIAEGLVAAVFPISKAIRLLGVTLSALDNEPEPAEVNQLALEI
jgi:DNA polymerase-4